VTARRIEEVAQVPIPCVGGERQPRRRRRRLQRQPSEGADSHGAVLFDESRNTSINIRGLGAPFGLTNDGKTGRGSIDGSSMPGPATLDFLDVQQIRVLRGPRGLFGKNDRRRNQRDDP
jgi:iron complex outermembrane receptor protein